MLNLQLPEVRSLFRRSQPKQARHLRNPANDKVIEVNTVIEMIVDGYNAGMDSSISALTRQIQSLPITERRVLFEGAAGGLFTAYLDGLIEYETIDAFLAQTDPYRVAITGLGLGTALSHTDTVLTCIQGVNPSYWSWMTYDAHGFHDGLFRWKMAISEKCTPPQTSILWSRAYDQGLGRSLFFVAGADPRIILRLIDKFPVERRADLWSGVGLMVAYWGALDVKDLRLLLKRSGEYRPVLQAAVAFAASLRLGADEPRDFTEAASQIICRAHSEEVARVADHCMLKYQGEPLSSASFVDWQRQMVEFFRSES